MRLRYYNAEYVGVSRAKDFNGVILTAPLENNLHVRSSRFTRQRAHIAREYERLRARFLRTEA